jgi:hypothetical protein
MSSTLLMHRVDVVQRLILTLERDTWADAYWRGVLECLLDSVEQAHA